MFLLCFGATIWLFNVVKWLLGYLGWLLGPLLGYTGWLLRCCYVVARVLGVVARV